jgi:hypothetical protein
VKKQYIYIWLDDRKDILDRFTLARWDISSSIIRNSFFDWENEGNQFFVALFLKAS